MTCEETGIVNLEDLPAAELYIELQKETHSLLEQMMRNYGVTKVARELDVSERILLHWLSDGSAIRLDILTKVCKFFNVEYKQQIRYLRGKKGNGIYNPRIPFDFSSCEGVGVIAGILGDGGMSAKRKNPYYINGDRNLIDSFISNAKSVFGDVEISSSIAKRKNTVLTNLGFPTLISEILNAIGIKEGKKVEINPSLPSFIFKLDERIKFSFFAQFFDDEGSVNVSARHISLTSACLAHYEKSNLLEDIKRLLAPLDILGSIYPREVYSSSRGKDRRIWRLQINGQIQLKKMYNNLNIKSQKKKNGLAKALKSFKLEIFRKRDITATYLNMMMKIEKTKGCFTSHDLAEASRRAIGSCRNTIIKFKKNGLIQCTKEPTSGDYHEYGNYVVVKNASNSRSPSS